MSVILSLNWTNDIFKCELTLVDSTIQSYILRNTLSGENSNKFTLYKTYTVDLSKSTTPVMVAKYPIKPDVDTVFTDMKRMMDKGIHDIIPTTEYNDVGLNNLIETAVYLLLKKRPVDCVIDIDINNQTATSSLYPKYPVDYTKINAQETRILFKYNN